MHLHVQPPLTLAALRRRMPWLLPAAVIAFAALAIGAVFNVLIWDRPLTAFAVSTRTPLLDAIILKVSFLGSNKVVFVVAGLAALAAAKRCPRLALAIVLIAVARPALEFVLKELVSRDRPVGDRLVRGSGYSFPSGHPLATAASWGLLPLVVGLYTKRRVIWWSTAIAAWTLAVLVAMSRVWLGVHWTSDVVASLLLCIIGVAGAERLVIAMQRDGCCRASRDGDEAEHVHADVVEGPVLQATP
jgi:undecaprenyl-diphosphatase